jgi:hypothetical protein
MCAQAVRHRSRTHLPPGLLKTGSMSSSANASSASSLTNSISISSSTFALRARFAQYLKCLTKPHPTATATATHTPTSNPTPRFVPVSSAGSCKSRMLRKISGAATAAAAEDDADDGADAIDKHCDKGMSALSPRSFPFPQKPNTLCSLRVMSIAHEPDTTASTRPAPGRGSRGHVSPQVATLQVHVITDTRLALPHDWTQDSRSHSHLARNVQRYIYAVPRAERGAVPVPVGHARPVVLRGHLCTPRGIDRTGGEVQRLGALHHYPTADLLTSSTAHIALLTPRPSRLAPSWEAPRRCRRSPRWRLSRSR